MLSKHLTPSKKLRGDGPPTDSPSRDHPALIHNKNSGQKVLIYCPVCDDIFYCRNTLNLHLVRFHINYINNNHILPNIALSYPDGYIEQGNEVNDQNIEKRDETGNADNRNDLALIDESSELDYCLGTPVLFQSPHGVIKKIKGPKEATPKETTNETKICRLKKRNFAMKKKYNDLNKIDDLHKSDVSLNKSKTNSLVLPDDVTTRPSFVKNNTPMKKCKPAKTSRELQHLLFFLQSDLLHDNRRLLRSIISKDGENQLIGENRHKDEKSSSDDKQLNDDNQRQDDKQSGKVVGKLFTCWICSKIYKGALNLKRHIRTHDENYAIKCKICLQIFVRHGNLYNHYKRAHKLATRTYTCSYCWRNFSTMRDMKDHVDCRPRKYKRDMLKDVEFLEKMVAENSTNKRSADYNLSKGTPKEFMMSVQESIYSDIEENRAVAAVTLKEVANKLKVIMANSQNEKEPDLNKNVLNLNPQIPEAKNSEVPKTKDSQVPETEEPKEKNSNLDSPQSDKLIIDFGAPNLNDSSVPTENLETSTVDLEMSAVGLEGPPVVFKVPSVKSNIFKAKPSNERKCHKMPQVIPRRPNNNHLIKQWLNIQGLEPNLNRQTNNQNTHGNSQEPNFNIKKPNEINGPCILNRQVPNLSQQVPSLNVVNTQAANFTQREQIVTLPVQQTNPAAIPKKISIPMKCQEKVPTPPPKIVKPYSCQICDMHFTKNEMLYHLAAHGTN